MFNWFRKRAPLSPVEAARKDLEDMGYCGVHFSEMRSQSPMYGGKDYYICDLCRDDKHAEKLRRVEELKSIVQGK